MFYTAEELLRATWPEEDYLVDPLIPSGGLVMLHGKRGLGKTQFSLTIAHAIVNGFPLFSRMETTRGKVMIVQVDMTPQIAKARLSRIAGHFKTDGLSFWVTPYLDVIGFSQKHELVRKIQEEKPSLVIWDTLRKIHHMKENQSETAQAVYSTIRRYVPEPAHLFIHHDKKTQIDRDGELDPEEAFRGTGDWLDSIDTSIQLLEIRGSGGLRMKIHKCRTMAEDERPDLDLKMDPETLLIAPNGGSVLIEEARSRIELVRELSNGHFDEHGAIVELVRNGFCSTSQARSLVRMA